MTRPPYDAAFKACAAAWVARKTPAASVIAEALGMPRQTRYRWMEAIRQHPTEPLGGQGPRRGENHRRQDFERAVPARAEEHTL